MNFVELDLSAPKSEVPCKVDAAGISLSNDNELPRTVCEWLVKNIPEMMVNLVGHQSARNGVLKVFESWQEKNLNRQLYYDLFELACLNLFPELQT